MKLYTEVIWKFDEKLNKYVEVNSICSDYSGPIALCGGDVSDWSQAAFGGDDPVDDLVITEGSEQDLSRSYTGPDDDDDNMWKNNLNTVIENQNEEPIIDDDNNQWAQNWFDNWKNQSSDGGLGDDGLGGEILDMNGDGIVDVTDIVSGINEGVDTESIEATQEWILEGESEYHPDVDPIDYYTWDNPNVEWFDNEAIARRYAETMQGLDGDYLSSEDAKLFWQDTLMGLNTSMTQEQFDTVWENFGEDLGGIHGYDPNQLSRLGRQRGMGLEQLGSSFGGDTGLSHTVGTTGLGLGSGLTGLDSGVGSWDQHAIDTRALNQAFSEDTSAYWDKLGGNIFDFATQILDPEGSWFE